jgi:hypothetical protein
VAWGSYTDICSIGEVPGLKITILLTMSTDLFYVFLLNKEPWLWFSRLDMEGTMETLLRLWVFLLNTDFCSMQQRNPSCRG